MWETLASVGASLLGSAMQEDASDRAVQAQTQSADKAIEEQRRQYDLTRSDLAPWRDTGSAAQRRLAVLLGLSKTSAPMLSRPLAPTREQFMRSTASGTPQLLRELAGNGLYGYDEHGNAVMPSWVRDRGSDTGGVSIIDGRTGEVIAGQGGASSTASGGNTFDQAGYDAALSQYDRDLAAYNAQQGVGAEDGYGELVRRFNSRDLEADPVYQSGLKFGLDQGTGAINARALQLGGYDSGATLKALVRFANDYGTTKAEGAYNRFNTDNTNIYNRLAGVSGSGQTAANTVASAGAGTANNVAELMTGTGNARAAGIVSGANAWGNGLNNAVSNYQSNQFLERLLPKSLSGGEWGGSLYRNF